MANVRRYDKIGRIWQKKLFSGQMTEKTGIDTAVMVQAYPAMTIPHRLWFSWRIFSDPDVATKPHYTEQMYINVRAANIDRDKGENASLWNSIANLQDIVEDYAPIDPDQNFAESTDANDVSLTGGELMSQQGKRSSMMHRKYTLGLPAHAMLHNSSRVMLHCIGSVSTDKNPSFKIKGNVDISEPYILVASMARIDPLDLDTGTEELSVLGNTNLSDLYDEFVNAIPQNMSTGDYTISGDDLDANVTGWQRTGYTNGDYQHSGDNDADLHYQLRLTTETSIYGSKSSTTIYAP